ncbi:MAG: DUF4381 domain-containing protein [Pseudohongiellaceae bacterium]
MDSDPLSQLADIHLPQQVGLWPLAPGWWILLCLLAALAVWGIILLRRRLHHRNLRLHALAELQRCRDALHSSPDADSAQIDYLNAVNTVLRRVALAHYPRSTVAGLTGRAWVDFLRSHGTLPLGEDTARALSEGRFAPRCDVDPDALQEAAGQWINSQYLSRIGTGESSGKTATHHA